MFDPYAALSRPHNSCLRCAFDADYAGIQTPEFRTKRQCIAFTPLLSLAACVYPPGSNRIPVDFDRSGPNSSCTTNVAIDLRSNTLYGWKFSRSSSFAESGIGRREYDTFDCRSTLKPKPALGER